MFQKNIRNFSIIAHIDHGKTTLTDRFLRLTDTITARQVTERMMDSNPIEKERGITIKLAPVRMHWKQEILNSKTQIPSNSQISNLRDLKEFRMSGEEAKNFKTGDKSEADTFAQGDTVTVIGVSKGKGFQGVVKRHGFAGGPASHGQKDRHRAPGSIGSSFPEHVMKGMRMAGRMGGEKITVKNLKVISVDKENQLIALSGAVPGRKGSLVIIKG